MKPLAIDLFCGLGGWTDGLLAEGFYVVGFDIERHVYGEHRYPAHLVLQDVLTLHGSQFKGAALIVASPPCQGYSYRAMPWSRAKALPPPDNTLFEACFRIQREACEAAGRHIPLIVENVRGAQKWVGRARWNFGSFYLWGDVPAIMPMTLKTVKVAAHFNKRDGHSHTRHLTNPLEHVKQRGSGAAWFDKALDERRRNPDGLKQPGICLSEVGFNVANALEFGAMVEGVKIKRTAADVRNHIGTKRKFASAMIAKIPLPLSQHIARTFKPQQVSVAA